MKHVMEQTLHNAYSALNAANRKLERGKMSLAEARTLMDIADRAHATIDRQKRMDDDYHSPYKDTNIGYGADVRQRGRTQNNTEDAVRNVMDAIDRILPHITNNRYENMDVNMRRGVPGTGRGQRINADRYDDDRYDMDDDRYDDDMDDLRPVNVPRWRSARTGRFLPNLYGPRRVRRVRRRADMDDMRYDNARYDDDHYDYYDDNARYNDNAERIARAAADAAANTARRMANDAYNAAPVMARSDYNRYNNARYDMRYDDRSYNRNDARNDTQNDMRNDTNNDYERSDDTTSDRSRRPGPGMKR